MKDYLEALLAEVEEEEEEQTEQETAFPLEEHLLWKKAAGMEERKAREEQMTPAPADMLGHRAAQEQAYPAAGETESGEREPPDLDSTTAGGAQASDGRGRPVPEKCAQGRGSVGYDSDCGISCGGGPVRSTEERKDGGISLACPAPGQGGGRLCPERTQWRRS